MAIHMPDTSAPMDIDQSQPRPETHTCYNCGESGHLSCTCMKPQKQRIWSTILAEMDLKGLVAEAVAASAGDVIETVGAVVSGVKVVALADELWKEHKDELLGKFNSTE